MFQYFVRHRHGVISVITAITLIAILSFSSLLTEIARYRNLNALYKEMTDNAAFSTLADYDKDLYERFALLAINQETDVETYLNCLETDMNGKNEDAKAIDQALEIVGDPEFEKIYDLQNLEVLKAQMTECGKYRTIGRGINDFTNIEDLLTDIVGKLEEDMAILTFMKSLSDVLNNLIDMLVATSELVSTSEEYNTAMNQYDAAITVYNNAIKARDDYLNGKHEKEKNYATTVAQNKATVEEAAAALSPIISSAKEKTIAYEKALNEFDTAYEKFQGGAIEAVLDEELVKIKNNSDDYDKVSEDVKKGLKKWIGDLKENYKGCNDLIDDAKDYVDDMQKKSFSGAIDTMQKQIDALGPVISDGTKGASIDGVDTVLGGIWSFVKAIITTVKNLLVLSESFTTTMKELGKFSTAMSLAFSMQTGFDYQYNNAYIGNLPSQNMTDIEYDFEAGDKKVVDDSAALADRVLKTGWPGKTLRMNSEGIAFFSHLSEVSDKMGSVATAFNNLLNANGIIKSLISLGKLIVAVGDLVDSMIRFVKSMAYKTVDELVKMVYQNIELSIYATSMFPNRLSKGDDTNLLGHEWSEYEDNWANKGVRGALAIETDNFSWARAEYVYAGTRLEALNQQMVFWQLYLFRMLLNLPCIFMDKTVMSIVEKCAAIPLIGIVVAVVVILLIDVVETYFDMVLLMGGKTVPIIKMEMYMDKGFDDFMKSLESIFVDGEDTEEYENAADLVKKKAKGYVDGFGWDYEAYLTIFIAFHGSKTIVKRSADLIQMEMRQMKKNNHETTEFKLDEMYTAIRVETNAEFSPLLPIPSVPSAKGTKIKLHNISYAHY